MILGKVDVYIRKYDTTEYLGLFSCNEKFGTFI